MENMDTAIPIHPDALSDPTPDSTPAEPFEPETENASEDRADCRGSQATLETCTISEAAIRIGKSTKTIRRLITAGKLSGEMVDGIYGPEWRIPVQDLSPLLPAAPSAAVPSDASDAPGGASGAASELAPGESSGVITGESSGEAPGEFLAEDSVPPDPAASGQDAAPAEIPISAAALDEMKQDLLRQEDQIRLLEQELDRERGAQRELQQTQEQLAIRERMLIAKDRELSELKEKADSLASAVDGFRRRPESRAAVGSPIPQPYAVPQPSPPRVSPAASTEAVSSGLASPGITPSRVVSPGVASVGIAFAEIASPQIPPAGSLSREPASAPAWSMPSTGSGTTTPQRAVSSPQPLPAGGGPVSRTSSYHAASSFNAPSASPKIAGGPGAFPGRAVSGARSPKPAARKRSAVADTFFPLFVQALPCLLPFIAVGAYWWYQLPYFRAASARSADASRLAAQAPAGIAPLPAKTAVGKHSLVNPPSLRPVFRNGASGMPAAGRSRHFRKAAFSRYSHARRTRYRSTRFH